VRILVFSTLLLVACGDRDLATDDRCNPLGGARCVTPWPSAIYELDDAATATGRRIEVPEGALPTNVDNITIEPTPYNVYDGFSPAAPILTAFATGVDDSNLVSFRDIGKSLTAESPTVLIDLSTGELVPHFAELDARAADQPASQALFIRPAQMLKGSTRYVVAIKKTLEARGGGPLPIPEGFQAILDGERTSHPLLERVRPRYDEIFAALEAQGIARTDLVVAWDFTTRSREQVRADLVNARTAALAMTGTDGDALDFEITADVAPNDGRIARRIDGTFDAPLFLTDGGSAAPSTTLVRDAAGHPMATGLYRAPFTAIIPECALTAAAPVPIIIYGHGLLGRATQVAGSGPANAAVEVCAVTIGTDMRGMSEPDVPNVVLALNDGNTGYRIFDVLIQGMMNHIALVQIARGPMAQRLFVKPNTTESLVDPSTIYYYGISQGGIMGGTVCAIDPVIRRCVLQVAAINYSMLLERSQDWPVYRTALIGAYPDPLDADLLITLMQGEWDRTEPTGIADVIDSTGFPDTPPKQVFVQIGIADDEVSNLASEYMARTMGLPTILPSPYVPYGLTGTSDPAPNGLVIYDFGLGSTIPSTNEAPPDNDVHGSLRNKQATTDMMKRFYSTGEIVQMCTAPNGCDCVAGGCGSDL
jgi:hypothetical protein